MEIVDILGWVFIAILVIIVLFGTIMGLRSLPDARRYFRIRRM